MHNLFLKIRIFIFYFNLTLLHLCRKREQSKLLNLFVFGRSVGWLLINMHDDKYTGLATAAAATFIQRQLRIELSQLNLWTRIEKIEYYNQDNIWERNSDGTQRHNTTTQIIRQTRTARKMFSNKNKTKRKKNRSKFSWNHKYTQNGVGRTHARIEKIHNFNQIKLELTDNT